MRRSLFIWLTALASVLRASAGEITQADVCIYGGTAAGVAAAVQVQRMGKHAVLLEPGYHLGGMTSGGLGATDIGNKDAIGGIAREFYHRVAGHYSKPESWNWESPEQYLKPRGMSLESLAAPDSTLWTFEPHVAENILFDMLNEAGAPVYFREPLASVKLERGTIQEIVTEHGRVFRARIFIDASYEGDLMAKADVKCFVGREANATYRETLNGVRDKTPKHQFTVEVDPYVKPGDATSGPLPFIQSQPLGPTGSEDRAIQAYNYRLCYTQNPANRMPPVPPPKYDPAQYELLARYLEALVAAGKNPQLAQFWNSIAMPNGKNDINNNGGFSTDFIGQNYDYPEADPARRASICKEHEDYTRGFVYFLATSPRVPENMRTEMQSWGPSKDEFADTGGWPHQLYIRESRRMISDYVMTEANCRGTQTAPGSIGLAAYTMDSHNCQRIARDGRVENEGDVQVGRFPPYPISYRSIVPRPSECPNLLVPVCLSASHIAYGSIRMEPVFMILAQSAATASVQALEENCSVQALHFGKLRERLLADKQRLQWPHK